MAGPVVTNRFPRPLSVAGVTDSVRFSIRDQSDQVDRGTILVRLGAGPAFYAGGVVPEDLELPFTLEAFSGKPGQFATRSIEPGGELKLEKDQASQNQEALYFFGGLNAPMAQDAPLMFEFTLLLNKADVANIGGDDYTGVVAGFFINDTGLTIRFFTDGASQRIEIYDGNTGSTQKPAGDDPRYLANFDWDGVEYTYKLLWHPQEDIVKLYVSSGQELDTIDTVLIGDGNVSDFPTLPASQIRENQPQAFFGHSAVDPTSISRWAAVYFYNIVTTPVSSGIPRGDHTGFVRTNELVEFDGTTSNKAEQPWPLLPPGFGPASGAEWMEQGELIVQKTKLTDSYGFYRGEPKLSEGPVVFDFALSGVLRKKDPASDSSGIEVFLDDGANEVRIGLLDAGGFQSMGIRRAGGSPSSLGGFEATLRGWSITSRYRLIYVPGDFARLSIRADTGDGLEDVPFITLAAADLPVAALFPPGSLGVVHNGNSAAASALFRLSKVRYETDVRLLDGSNLPPAPWVLDGDSASVGSTGATLVLTDADDSAALSYYRPDSFGSDEGVSVEFRCQIDSWEVDGETNPSRELTGVSVLVDDGTFQTRLVFAEAGELGKIIFLATNSNLKTNLTAIRSGAASTAGTFAVVDWTSFHIYRIQKSINGRLTVSIDEADPSIDLEQVSFAYPPSTSTSRVTFGSLRTDRKSTSQWSFVNYSLSDGFDFSIAPNLSESELLERFAHAVNVVVEASDTV